jgi:hypothetical protein
MSFRARLCTLVASSLLFAGPALAQGPPNADSLLMVQRAALARLSFMDGVWRGQATTALPSGEKKTVTQTERIGPFLDGAVRVIEGRGYDADGKVAFNAFGILSYDPAKKAITMRSYAMGMAGDFAYSPADWGYVCEIPAGGLTIRYTAAVHGGKWHEIGERVVTGGDAVRFFDMTLTRVGDSGWPAGGAIPPR